MRQDLSNLDWLEQRELASREASEQGYIPPHDECVGVFHNKEVYVDDDGYFYTYQGEGEWAVKIYDNAATLAAYEEFDDPEGELQAQDDFYC